MGGRGGDAWTDTHCQQLQQGKVSDPAARRHDAVVHKLAHPATPFPLVCSSSASFSTSALAESQLLPATARCVCVFVCVLD